MLISLHCISSSEYNHWPQTHKLDAISTKLKSFLTCKVPYSTVESSINGNSPKCKLCSPIPPCVLSQLHTTPATQSPTVEPTVINATILVGKGCRCLLTAAKERSQKIRLYSQRLFNLFLKVCSNASWTLVKMHILMSLGSAKRVCAQKASASSKLPQREC